MRCASTRRNQNYENKKSIRIVHSYYHSDSVYCLGYYRLNTVITINYFKNMFSGIPQRRSTASG